MRSIKRDIGKYLIDLIIILEAFVISTSYFFESKINMVMLGGVVGASYLLGVLLFFERTFHRKEYRLSNTLYILLIISSLVYSVFYRDNFKTILIFLSSIVFLYYLYIKGLDKRNINLLIFTSLLLVIIHLIGTNIEGAFNSSNDLVSVWDNSNMTGIVIMSTLLPLVPALFYVRKLKYKILIFIFFIISITLLISTFNRGSIIQAIVLIGLLIINFRRYKERRILRLLLILFPVFIVIVYINYFILFSPYITFLNKSLLVRPGWPVLLSIITQNPLHSYNLPSGGLNIALAGIIEIGIGGMILFLSLLLTLKPRWRYPEKLRYPQVAYLAFLTVFIQQGFENTLINCAYGLYIYAYLLLGIATSEFLKLENVPSRKIY